MVRRRWPLQASVLGGFSVLHYRQSGGNRCHFSTISAPSGEAPHLCIQSPAAVNVPPIFPSPAWAAAGVLRKICLPREARLCLRTHSTNVRIPLPADVAASHWTPICPCSFPVPFLVFTFCQRGCDGVLIEGLGGVCGVFSKEGALEGLVCVFSLHGLRTQTLSESISSCELSKSNNVCGFSSPKELSFDEGTWLHCYQFYNIWFKF